MTPIPIRNSTLVLTPDTEIWFQTTIEQLLEAFQSQFPPKFLRIEIKFKIYVTMLNYCQKKILLYFHEDVLTLLSINDASVYRVGRINTI